MEKVEENYKVPNLEKGIAVLEYLSLHTQGETLQAIKSDLDISQTTAYRILNTLVRLDYLIYNEDTKRQENQCRHSAAAGKAEKIRDFLLGIELTLNS